MNNNEDRGIFYSVGDFENIISKREMCRVLVDDIEPFDTCVRVKIGENCWEKYSIDDFVEFVFPNSGKKAVEVVEYGIYIR